jgi:glycosyltransferase involved in cell wall biosynthesis
MDRRRPDVWLTYHTYYKGPDILGPPLSVRSGIPYVIFQGIYATKRKRKLKSWPGYVLNTRALCTAGHVFTNKRKDLLNLDRILPANRRTYVKPGILPEDFSYHTAARDDLRRSWKVGNDPVILSAAMFRPDVKTQGLMMVIRACGRLFQKGKRFFLAIAGDGKEKNRLMRLAQKHLPEKTRFVGKIPRDQMYRFYSAGDVFVFPGIRESLGMVYLEAQSCGVPVVAFSNEGTPEVIKHRKTGILVPAFDFDAFTQAIEVLLDEETLRRRMSRAARVYVREHHDIDTNYRVIEDVLYRTIEPGSLNP